MNYYLRQKHDGTVFYINESGEEVSEATARTNLVGDTTRRQTFTESRMNRGGLPREQAEAEMEEAFARFMPEVPGVTQRPARKTTSGNRAAAKMEEAFARFVPRIRNLALED